MKNRKLACGCAAALAILPVLLAGAVLLWQFVRPQPRPVTKTFFEGIEYTRAVRDAPREMVIHVLTIDLEADGIRVLVTPGESDTELPLSARTTSEFLEDYDLQVAVNGSFFEPWTSFSFVSYYPHSGDPVDAIGFAASEGTAYSQAHPDAPTLYFAQNNNARFNRPFANLYNAISGSEMLVENGKVVASEGGQPEPRTAAGLSRSENTLILLVVDGRQPGYSGGATLQELADILVEFGAHDAMNLDGGGSSTMVRQGAFGQAVLVNNPIARNIPGWERPVGNHLGIYAKKQQ